MDQMNPMKDIKYYKVRTDSYTISNKYSLSKIL